MLSKTEPSPPPVARSIARWMFSRGMFTPRARSIARRRRKLPSGSPPPSFAASMISLVILVKTTPRLTAPAAFTHEGVKINLIDTPGYADFAADQRAGMRIADAAIVFVDASAGIQVGTQIAWNELEARRTPRVFLIGRLDRENADFDEVL